MQKLVNIRFCQNLLYCLTGLCVVTAMYYSLTPYMVYTKEIPSETLNIKPEEPTITRLPELGKNLECYYSVEGDALPSAEDPKFASGDDAIFFHETSCRGGINSRQACAIESAARLHPTWQISLLFSSPVNESMLTNSVLAKLLQFQNVKFARLHIEEYGKGTAVEQILRHQLKESLHPIEHAADILRILTMHKFGGVYLDTDSMLIQNLTTLPPNWIAKESGLDIASGAMAFSKEGIGVNVTGDILIELRDTFIPSSWSYNGPKAIQRVLERLCPKVLETTGDCGGIEILSSKSFYPVHYSRHREYFVNGTIDDVEGTYMHHMWNYLTKDLKIEMDSPYANLARRFCPTIYEMYGDHFGD